jgi:hypothetical protein
MPMDWGLARDYAARDVHTVEMPRLRTNVFSDRSVMNPALTEAATTAV